MQGVSCFAVLRRWEGQGSDIFVGQASGCHEGLGACLATLWQQGWYGNPWRILAQDTPWRLASDAGFWAVGRHLWCTTAHGGRDLYGPQQHVPLPAERELDD